MKYKNETHFQKRFLTGEGRAFYGENRYILFLES